MRCAGAGSDQGTHDTSVQRQLLLPRASLPRDAEREKAWRQRLTPYYEELGLDAASVAAGPVRAPFEEAAADVLEACKPAVVSFISDCRRRRCWIVCAAWGSKILSSATTVEEARWLEAHGVDAVIAQGLEAGGHRGMFLSNDLSKQLGTFALLPQVIDAV